jgi:hypothetical protein
MPTVMVAGLAGSRACDGTDPVSDVRPLPGIANLELEALYGGFACEPFTDDSREYVFIARRPISGDIP